MLQHPRARWLLLPVMGASLAMASAAQAIQTSASLSPVLSKYGDLVVGDEPTLKLRANNTSTDTPPDSAPMTEIDRAARLSGVVTVSLNCASFGCSCATRDPGVLVFVPTGPKGCVSADPAVVSCAAGGPDDVLITIADPGILIPPGGSIDVATLKLRVASPVPPFPGLAITAATEEGGVIACAKSDTPPVPGGICVPCCAFGCTTVTPFIAVGESCPKRPHLDAATVLFRGGRDRLALHFAVKLPEALTSLNNTIGVKLETSGGVVLFDHTLPPGTLTPYGPTNFRFHDGTATASGGFFDIEVNKRCGPTVGGPAVYAVDIVGYLDQDGATTAMTLTLEVDGQTFIYANGIPAGTQWVASGDGIDLDFPFCELTCE